MKPRPDAFISAIRSALQVTVPTEQEGWFSFARLKEISGCASDSVLQKKLRIQMADWEKTHYQGYVYYRRKSQ